MIQSTNVVTGKLNGRTFYLHQPEPPDGLYFATDSARQAKKFGEPDKAQMVADRENNLRAANVPNAKIWRDITWRVKRIQRDALTGEVCN